MMDQIQSQEKILNQAIKKAERGEEGEEIQDGLLHLIRYILFHCKKKTLKEGYILQKGPVVYFHQLCTLFTCQKIVFHVFNKFSSFLSHFCNVEGTLTSLYISKNNNIF